MGSTVGVHVCMISDVCVYVCETCENGSILPIRHNIMWKHLVTLATS